MWALLSRRFRRWLLLIVGAPLAARGLHRTADVVEARWGRSMVTSGLRGLAKLVPRRHRKRR